MRFRVLTFLVVVLGIAALSGWFWGWREHDRRASVEEFIRRRCTLLESENQRLAKTLADQQRSVTLAADRTRRAEIERTVADLRGLKFLRPVVYREIPRSELPAILRQKLAQQVPDREFGNTGVALAALGLLPPNTDLKKTYLDLLGEQVGAFYDQHSEELVTFSGQPLENSQNRVILAHELTHALEDQHFQLARLPLEAKGNDDRALAASALVEGDATLVMSRYMIGDLSAASLKDTLVGTLGADMRRIASAPRYLRETLLFPYLRGQEFCQALYESGGWEALAEAFRHPPDSTAQILHPERFLARSSLASVNVEFPATAVLGQEPIGDNVLGEFGVRQWLARWLKDEGRANRIASDWWADRYRVYGDAQASSFIWKSDWSSAAAASTFRDAAVSCWCARYHLEPLSFTSETIPTSQRAVLRDGRRLVFSLEDTRVIMIDAQNDHWENALRGLIGGDPKTKLNGDVQLR